MREKVMRKATLPLAMVSLIALGGCETTGSLPDAPEKAEKCFADTSYYQPPVRVGEAGKVVSSRKEVMCEGGR